VASIYKQKTRYDKMEIHEGQSAGKVQLCMKEFDGWLTRRHRHAHLTVWSMEDIQQLMSATLKH